MRATLLAGRGDRVLQWGVPTTPAPRPRALLALAPAPHAPRRCGRGAATRAAPKGQTEQVFLSDLIAFESDAERAAAGREETDPTARVQEIIDRATKVLEAAKGVLGADGLPLDPEHAPDAAAAPAAVAPAPAPRSVVGRVGGGVAAAAQKPPGPSGGAAPATPGPSGPPRAGGGGPGAAEALTRRWGPPGGEADTTRHVLQSALDEMSRSGAPLPSDGGGSGGDGSMFLDLGGGGGLGSAEGGGAAPPSWAQSFLSAPDSGSSLSSADAGGGSRSGGTPRLRLQAAPARPAPGGLAFAEPELPPPPTAALLFRSQGEDDAARARSAVLPPLQSIMELTSAFRPPERGAPAAEAGEPGAAAAGAVGAGRALADGAGALPDGSTWEKKSGVEYGVNGYWKRWHLLRGTADGGRVQWEETWWEASDWTGYKEMGAEKSGNDAAGGAWKEAWTERLHYADGSLDCVVERDAHKWAHSPNGDEWEEKWGEYYHAGGRVDKYADKWGKQGPNVWHEKWGEDYDGHGAVIKWTDKWAERLLPGGAREQWGDKWRESFADGQGDKNGEVWSVDGSGHRYQRWWGEHHPGDGSVRRYGNSTAGEQWDERVAMDTYYNPVPHFGYKLALEHSPQLRNVPLRPKDVDDDDPFGPGIDDL